MLPQELQKLGLKAPGSNRRHAEDFDKDDRKPQMNRENTQHLRSESEVHLSSQEQRNNDFTSLTGMCDAAYQKASCISSSAHSTPEQQALPPSLVVSKKLAKRLSSTRSDVQHSSITEQA